jgi:hypothetical protein
MLMEPTATRPTKIWITDRAAGVVMPLQRVQPHLRDESVVDGARPGGSYSLSGRLLSSGVVLHLRRVTSFSRPFLLLQAH